MEQKYWHTKQTMIQKLGKEQDSYVVAGDSEVDARLEVGTDCGRCEHFASLTLFFFCFGWVWEGARETRPNCILWVGRNQK